MTVQRTHARYVASKQERLSITYRSVISRHQQTRLTYDALDIKSNAFARGLFKIGVKKGDRVAVSLGNNIEYAIVWFLKF